MVYRRFPIDACCPPSATLMNRPSSGLTVHLTLVNAPTMDTETMTSDAVVALSFEDALRELEAIVRKLESGDAPLEESITLYTRGEALRAQCTRRLADAEAKIQKLTLNPAGDISGAQPFDAS